MNFDDYIVDTVALLENADDAQHVAPSDDADAEQLFHNAEQE